MCVDPFGQLCALRLLFFFSSLLSLLLLFYFHFTITNNTHSNRTCLNLKSVFVSLCLAVPFSIAFFSFISCYSFGSVLFICNTKNRILICTNKIDLFSSVFFFHLEKKNESKNTKQKEEDKKKTHIQKNTANKRSKAYLLFVGVWSHSCLRHIIFVYRRLKSDFHTVCFLSTLHFVIYTHIYVYI